MSGHTAVATELGLSGSAHAIQFFSSDARLTASVGEYVRAAMAADATCIVIATPEHHAGIARHLRRAGLDPEALASSYAYIALEARTILDMFMQNGRPDRERFHRIADELIR